MREVHFTLPILFVLTLASERIFSYGTVAFWIFVLSTKKRYSNFVKKVFQKICFKIKALKTFEISSDCHIKTHRTLKRRAILKTASTFLGKTYALSVDSKTKPLKPHSNFPVNLAERSNRSLSVYLMNHLFQTFVLFNM